MSRPRGQSGSWRSRQESDLYVQRARKAGWRSRSVYKLEQICKKERLLKANMTCVDLGAAPGGWSQYVSTTLKGKVKIIAVDRLPMDPLPGVELVTGDFTEAETLERVLEILGPQRAGLVMSDMAPNITGNKVVDQPRSMYLAELALELARNTLAQGGDFVCKVFQGQGSEAFLADARRDFSRVRCMKPDASRPSSSEIYLVARNYQL